MKALATFIVGAQLLITSAVFAGGIPLCTTSSGYTLAGSGKRVSVGDRTGKSVRVVSSSVKEGSNGKVTLVATIKGARGQNVRLSCVSTF